MAQTSLTNLQHWKGRKKSIGKIKFSFTVLGCKQKEKMSNLQPNDFL